LQRKSEGRMEGMIEMIRLWVLNESARAAGNDRRVKKGSLAHYIEHNGFYHGYYLEGGRIVQKQRTFEQRKPNLETDYHEASPEEKAQFQAKRKKMRRPAI
jgi:hypothetical protein